MNAPVYEVLVWEWGAKSDFTLVSLSAIACLVTTTMATMTEMTAMMAMTAMTMTTAAGDVYLRLSPFQ